MIKYFHELTEEEYQTIVDSGKFPLMKDFEKEYPQPVWCSYPDALYGKMGCWSLVGFKIKTEKDCKICELYKPILAN